MPLENIAETTFEKIESTGIIIHQPKDGYRYGQESIELANLVRLKKNDRMADLGCGCGIIGLMIAARDKPREVMLVERQEDLASIANHNIELNKIGNAKCKCDDYRNLSSTHESFFDVVVSNPPFVPQGKGKPCKETQRNDARMENHGTLDDLIACSHRLLSQNGALWIVLPTNRQSEIQGELRGFALSEKHMIGKHVFTKLIKK